MTFAALPDYSKLPIQVFASIGFATVGGALTGWGAALITRTYFAQTLPPKVQWFVRTLGFVACGLVAWFVLSGGGPGGGLGGWGPFAGDSTGGDKDGVAKKDDKPPVKDKEPPPPPKDKTKDKDGGPKAKPEESLKVEVLGQKALRRFSETDVRRQYRLEGSKERLTKEQVQEALLKRNKAGTPVRLVTIVLYQDSPAEGNEPVQQLRDWLEGREMAPMKVDVLVKGGEEAP